MFDQCLCNFWDDEERWIYKRSSTVSLNCSFVDELSPPLRKLQMVFTRSTRKKKIQSLAFQLSVIFLLADCVSLCSKELRHRCPENLRVEVDAQAGLESDVC